MEVLIRSYLEEALELDTSTLANEHNLIEFGLNSLALMFILEKISNASKRKLNYADFVNSPTINEWLQLIESAEKP